ncbi:MAG: nitrophenyl compound nitroreductase subunit ArsF family protein [Candidatus Omnitrophica bacterium]|nr:nitrophenyl compound nitroreductase subunit ArsF family protein [Candidatus Omnitrophota bacterium]
MFRKLFLALCILGFITVSFAADKPSAEKVYAYYFHGSVRCSTCFKLEQYSKEAIESNFKPELASGKLEFRAVNIEEKINAHFVNDYQLYTKTLVLSLVKDGREIKSKNLNKIWEFVGNKDKFMAYIKEEAANFLKDS